MQNQPEILRYPVHDGPPPQLFIIVAEITLRINLTISRNIILETGI